MFKALVISLATVLALGAGTYQAEAADPLHESNPCYVRYGGLGLQLLQDNINKSRTAQEAWINTQVFNELQRQIYAVLSSGTYLTQAGGVAYAGQPVNPNAGLCTAAEIEAKANKLGKAIGWLRELSNNARTFYGTYITGFSIEGFPDHGRHACSLSYGNIVVGAPWFPDQSATDAHEDCYEFLARWFGVPFDQIPNPPDFEPAYPESIYIG